MGIRSALLCVALPLFATWVSGCAPAYHCYSGCRIPCKYCPPPPLPYPHYGGCLCHSHPAERYLAVPLADGREGDVRMPSEGEFE